MNYQLQEICQIQQFKYNGEVYDLNVQNDHTYNIQGLIVHNSSTGSLLFYLLGVTSLDPVKYNLMFQRFINPSVKVKSADDLPDADLDFQDPDKLRQVLRQKYGQKNVAQGAIFSSYAPKSLLKDILKYYDVPFEKANEVTKYFDEIQSDIKSKAQDKAPDFSIQVLEQYEQFKKVFAIYPNAEEPFRTLYKRKRHIGRHAGAVVYLQNLTQKIPQYRSKGQVITSWGESGGNLKTLSKNGFVKFDFLGLKTLRIIHRAVDLIKQNYNIDIDFRKINLQDQKVYQQTFNNQRFTGIFQFTSKGMKSLCQRVRPKSIQDISAIISLYRPACLKNDFHTLYLQNKNNGDAQYIHPKVKQILQNSYGTILYQEQVFQLVRQIGGYSFDDIGLFKKYILKVGAAKKYKDYNQQLRIFRLKFITHGNQKLKIDKKQVEYLYDQILKFASYGFALNHSMPYSALSYTCAWFLTYYQTEWLCALINENAEQSLPQIVKMYKPYLLPLDLFKSQVQTTTQKYQDGSYRVRLGFHIIKGLGQKSLQSFMNMRNQIKTPQDFIFGVTPSIAQKLIASGAADCIDKNRKKLLLATLMTKQKKQDKLTRKNFGQKWIKLKSVEPYTIQELYDLQYNAFGMNIFVNIWQTYSGIIKNFIMKGKAVLDFTNFVKFNMKIGYIPINIRDIKTRKQKNGKQMAFLKVVTPSGQFSQIPIFAQAWQYLKKRIKPDFSVYFGLFSYNQEKKCFNFGDNSYLCNEKKAATYLLNIKYIIEKQGENNEQ